MTRLYACTGSGNCFKPWLVIRQLDLPHQLVMIDVLRGEQKSPEYLAVNPLGVVPFLLTHSGARIGESNAMAWFLAENSPLMPARAEDRAEALQWMFFEQSRLEAFISPARFYTTILPHERHNRAADIAAWQARAKPGLTRLDDHLSQRAFILASGYSVADIAVFGYVHVLQEAGLSLSDLPNVERWIGEVTQTDGFRPLADLGMPLTAAA
jgi:glutathione S-transferase